MNSASGLPNSLFCSAGFIPLPDTHGYVEYMDEEHSSYAEYFGLDRPDSENAKTDDCRIDFSLFGECYAAILHFSSPLHPSRIDLHIPEQTEWPPELWSVLGAKDSVHTIGARVNELAILATSAEPLPTGPAGPRTSRSSTESFRLDQELWLTTSNPTLLTWKFPSGQIIDWGASCSQCPPWNRCGPPPIAHQCRRASVESVAECEATEPSSRLG